MFILGLTGSVGMGKSTAAQFFREEGVPVHDADAAVHRLYEGEAVAPIETAFPGTTQNGKVDRIRLANRVLGDPAALALGRDRASAGAQGGGALSRRGGEARRGNRGARHSVAVRDRRRGALRCRGGRYSAAGRAARACDGATGHDDGEIRGHPREADAGRRKTGARRFRRGQRARIRRCPAAGT